MKRNIMHELYSQDAGKKEDEIKNKESENEGKNEASENEKLEKAYYTNQSKTHLVCPKCGGERIKPATMTGIAVYGAPDQRYSCEDCDYIGSLVLDVEEHEKSESDIAVEEDLIRIKKELEFE